VLGSCTHRTRLSARQGEEMGCATDLNDWHWQM
jgi:hypothetical protein